MKIEITRSFSQRIQAKQFEPVESTCSITESLEYDKKDTILTLDEAKRNLSITLDKFCKDEVRKSLEEFIPKNSVAHQDDLPF